MHIGEIYEPFTCNTEDKWNLLGNVGKCLGDFKWKKITLGGWRVVKEKTLLGVW